MGAQLSLERPANMRSRMETETADASSVAPAESAPQTDAAEDAQDADASNEASDVSMEALEPEKSARESDAAVGAQDVSEKEAPVASEGVPMEEKQTVGRTVMCCECDRVESASRGDELRVCVGCNVAVHLNCYSDALPALETMEGVATSAQTEKEDETMESSGWKCDCCREGVQRRDIKCVYCEKAGGEAVLKAVEGANDAAFWRQWRGCEGDIETDKEEAKFGHVLCINWDPRRLAAHTAKEGTCKRVEKPPKKKEPEKETVENAVDNEATKNEDVQQDKQPVGSMPSADEILMRELPPNECCFCHSTAGVRIQCRRVYCAQYFHVMCAHQGVGHVELRTAGIPQFHAYCARHCDCTEDVGDLLAKLITRPIRLLVGRDDMRRFGTVAKHLPQYTSAAAVIRDIASLVVGYCHKGLRTCKVEPPDYNVKHLQVLQFFLSHVPQLEKVYALPSTPAQDIVNDKKLFRRLERLFSPPRYSSKYPGPFSQQYTCDVCLDPFHERQHLFYCAGGDESAIPHVQHWRCTKHRSNIREREQYLPVAGNTAKKKRKAISIVHNGVRKDVTLPKGLVSMTDDRICGVCRAPVDTRGLIASRKEAKMLDFEKKESRFVQNGCYINPIGAKGYTGYSYGPASTSTARKPMKVTDTWKLNGSVSVQHAAAQQALGPPKMDRINVQRTMKWLTCVAQIIRLVGASVPKPLPASVSATSTADVQSEKPSSAKDKHTVSDEGTNHGTIPATPAASVVTVPKDVPNKEAIRLTANGSATPTSTKPDGNGSVRPQPEAEKSVQVPTSSPTTKPNNTPLVTTTVQALFDEAMRLLRPYDSYALTKLETAHDMLVHRSGPGVAVLRMLTQEYTRFVYIKHTRAVEKARNEKRKRAEHEAQQHREKERKRVNLEAERALKKQMLAMRNKQRQHLKATSSK